MGLNPVQTDGWGRLAFKAPPIALSRGAKTGELTPRQQTRVDRAMRQVIADALGDQPWLLRDVGFTCSPGVAPEP
jgi:hypothetical protein